MTVLATEVKTGFYVSVVDGRRKGLLLGPYDEHEQALANVERAQAESEAVDPFAHFYAFGTCKVQARGLPTGRLNERLHLWPCAMCGAGVRHETCEHTGKVRVGTDYHEEPTEPDH